VRGVLVGLALFTLWMMWPAIQGAAWANLGTIGLSKAMVGGDTSRVGAAQACLERAIRSDAGNGRAYRNLGRLAVLQGDLSAAVSALTQATEVLPHDVWADVELGDVYWDLGRKDEAVNSWVRAASVDPGFVERLEREAPEKGGRFTTRSEYERVLTIVAEAAVTAHPGRVYPYLLLGRLARDRGDYPEATRWFSLAAQVDRSTHIPMRELGIVAEMEGRYDLAEAYFREAIAREPRQPANYASLAHAYAQRQQFDLAVDWYRRALVLHPDNPSYHNGLAQAYYQLGRYADALAEYRQMLAIEPNNEAVQELVAALEQRLETKASDTR